MNDIRKNVNMNDWYYCRSEVNAADIITKCGGDPKSAMWWNCPDFLYQVIFNPEGAFDCDISLPPEIMEEVSRSNYNSVLLASQENSNLIGNIIDIERFNKLLKLLRVTSYVLRFVSNLKCKINNKQSKMS